MTSVVSALMGIFILSAAPMGQTAWAAGSGKAVDLSQATSYKVTITGYNAVPGQTDSDPFTTASGAYSNPEIVAARSQDLADELPFGTVIALVPSDTSDPNCGYPVVSDKIGLRVIADAMNARMHNKVDLLFGTKDTVSVGGRQRNAANALGICSNVKVVVVGHVDIAKVPKTQNELAAMLSGGGPALAVAN
jgi:3D (Asp-Asp-Asp) domain-containing protein